MNPYSEIISHIIKEQEAIIGPIALEQAKKVSGLTVKSEEDIEVTGTIKDVLNALVNQYAKLFGQASVEVCKEAFLPYADKISVNDIPTILKS